MLSLETVKGIIDNVKGKADTFEFESHFLQTFSIPKNKVQHISVKEDMNTDIFSVNDIIELPDTIKEIVSDNENYYIYGCHSLFDSILFGSMLDYKLFSDDKKKQVQHDFKLDLISKIKELTTIHTFKTKSYQLTENLNDGTLDHDVLLYISHFLKRK